MFRKIFASASFGLFLILAVGVHFEWTQSAEASATNQNCSLPSGNCQAAVFQANSTTNPSTLSGGVALNGKNITGAAQVVAAPEGSVTLKGNVTPSGSAKQVIIKGPSIASNGDDQLDVQNGSGSSLFNVRGSGQCNASGQFAAPTFTSSATAGTDGFTMTNSGGRLRLGPESTSYLRNVSTVGGVFSAGQLNGTGTVGVLGTGGAFVAADSDTSFAQVSELFSASTTNPLLVSGSIDDSSASKTVVRVGSTASLTSPNSKIVSFGTGLDGSYSEKACLLNSGAFKADTLQALSSDTSLTLKGNKTPSGSATEVMISGPSVLGNGDLALDVQNGAGSHLLRVMGSGQSVMAGGADIGGALAGASTGDFTGILTYRSYLYGRAGTPWAFTAPASGGAQVLNNGTATTPNVHFIWGANHNFSFEANGGYFGMEQLCTYVDRNEGTFGNVRTCTAQNGDFSVSGDINALAGLAVANNSALVGGVTIGSGGSAITGSYKGTTTNPGSIASGTTTTNCVDVAVTMPAAAAVGSTCAVGLPAAGLGSASLFVGGARIASSTNGVIVLCNGDSIGAHTPSAGTYTLRCEN